MNKKKTRWLLPLVALLAGCSQGNEPEMDYSVSDNDVRIVGMVKDFYKSVNSDKESRSGGLEDLVVDNISRKYYTVSEDTIAVPVSPETRSSEDGNIFDISTVEFHIGEDRGYAVLSEAERVNTMFFFTENGLPGDTAFIEPLKYIIDSAPGIAAVMSTNPGGGNGGPSDNEPIKPALPPDDGGGIDGGGNTTGGGPYKYGPLLKTFWHQGYPFNRFAKECPEDYGNDKYKESHKGHVPIGCWPVALAQVIAYFGKFEGTFYGNKNIDFYALAHDEMPDDEYQAGLFLHEIALGCQIKFGADGSGTTPKSVFQYMRDIGFDCEYHKGAPDLSKMKILLSKGLPILAGGGHHAFVVDGSQRNGTTTTWHINWGWGSDSQGVDNGWANSYCIRVILDEKFNKKEEEYSDNSTHIFINTKYE